MDCKIAAWDIRGLGKVTKQNEVKKLIMNENLSVCAVLETHMKKIELRKLVIECLVIGIGRITFMLVRRVVE